MKAANSFVLGLYRERNWQNLAELLQRRRHKPTAMRAFDSFWQQHESLAWLSQPGGRKNGFGDRVGQSLPMSAE